MAQSQPSGDYVHQEAALQTRQDASPGVVKTTTAAATNDVQPKASWSQGTAAAAGVAAKETFGCQHCSKSFNRRENLSRHLKTRRLSPILPSIKPLALTYFLLAPSSLFFGGL